jgi:hypothetical protein
MRRASLRALKTYQYLGPVGAIELLDTGVLRGLARLDQDEIHAMLG